MECYGCGSPIPSGQGGVCSMCYGDPEHGTDGYYKAMLEDDMSRQEQREQEREE